VSRLGEKWSAMQRANWRTDEDNCSFTERSICESGVRSSAINRVNAAVFDSHHG